MDRTNFPNGGVSADSTVSIVAAYDADAHTVSVTLNGAPYERASAMSRAIHAAHAVMVLNELESTLHNQYNADPEDFRPLFVAALSAIA